MLKKLGKFLNNSIFSTVFQILVLLILCPLLFGIIAKVLPDQGQTFANEGGLEAIGEFSKGHQVVMKIAVTIDQAVQQIDVPLERIVMDGNTVIRQLSSMARDLARDLRELGVSLPSSGTSGAIDGYGESLDAYAQQHMDELKQFFSDLLAAIIPSGGMILGVMFTLMVSNAQNWCILLSILCLKTMFEDGLHCKFLSAPLSVLGVFCGLMVWGLYGGQAGDSMLLLLAIIFLMVLNFVLRLFLKGLSVGKTIAGCVLDVMQEAFSVCYLYALTRLIQYPPTPFAEIVAIMLITTGVLVLTSWLRKLA